MTTAHLLVGALCGLVGAVAGLGTPWLVRRLPEPELEPGEDKQPYAVLGRWPPLAPVGAGIGVVSCGAAGLRLGTDPELAAVVYVCAVAITLGYVDVRTHRLPNAVVLPSYAVVAALVLGISVLTAAWGGLLFAAIGGALLWGSFFVVMIIYPAGMGFGDVKLAGLLGIVLGWLGLEYLVVGVFAAFLLGGLSGLVLMLARRANRRTSIPFGPFLLLGFWAAVLSADLIAGWYLGTI